LKAHVSAQLARFKVPRDFVFVDDLPRTALGKVQHFKLKEIAGEKPVKIAVLAAAMLVCSRGRFALQGHEVRLWRRDAAAVEAHRASGSRIVVKGCQRPPRRAACAGRDRYRGSDPRRRADPVPRPPLRSAISQGLLAPHLRDCQVVFLPPATFGSLIFAKAAHDAGNHAAVAFAETGTLPWLARKHGPFEVAITIRAKRLPVGVFPLKDAGHALDVIGRAFPGVIEPCGDAYRVR